ncbi:ABC transporter permease [Promicromonospora thailandica]|uniref:ABC-2 type transport system permease protein n=1 Tax=Promicromonospora thailandica TaxID=765201 RepID=A0A9X2FXT7_9MICO|nr:ABC transporter permease [Promicromonospora thailandica]MCP2263305.1 ABC-2 type transport system permease protein [Promicromonospora thailandica]
MTGPTRAGDTARNAWMVVATREIVVRALNKGFVIGLLVTIALIGGLIGFTSYMESRTESFDVAVVAGDESAATALDSLADGRGAASSDDSVEVTVVRVDDAAAAEAALADETADAWLSSAAGGDGEWTLSGWREPDGTLARLVGTTVRGQVLADRAAGVGTSMDDLTAGSEVVTERLDGNPVDPQVVFVAGFVLAFLFFMGAVGSGSMIAGSVIEEKQSRLVEIIATAVPLRQLLAGKIVGSSVIALGQNLVLAGVGLVGASFTDLSSILPSMTASMLWFVVFFTVGFVAVAALYAVAGSLASRTEDLQYTTSPLMMLLMAVYIVTFSADGVLERVLSYIPPASIVSMPVRVLAGDTLWWEPLLSLAILVATTVGAVLLSERAYRGALMQTGGRVSWRSAMAAERGTTLGA